ncbi:MAG: 2-hydroxyacyl-CoA dehydratase [Chloroflexi bacterium]|nr:2-hydroxyacyl-CoA dehydratase [Chloroflexota bacterium]MBL7062338.1 2-hydroxyacyl-CoA dehydratase [Dehalococcoidia bacterium]
MDTLEELAQIARTRPERLKECKEKGIKLIGYIGRFVPEELIYASGALPYLLCRGGQPEPPDAVIPYMLRFMSPYSRSQIGYHLLGIDPVVPMLDLIVVQCSDCHESRLADLFEYFKLPTARLGVPPDWEKSLSRDYYYKELTRLREKLEVLTGNKISDGKLKESIEFINKIRDLLRKINLLRREQPPRVGGYDFIRLNHYSFYCDPEVLIGKLKDLYEELQKGKSPFSTEAPRILLAGHVVGVGDYVVPKLIEDSGGVIAAEFLDEGVRHCAWNVKTDGDLMRSLGETHYLERTPPSIFQPAWEERVEIMKKLIRDFKIDGVIWYELSFEEIYDLECSIISKVLNEMNIPLLKLESSYEYSREAVGPLTTRVESFIELVKQRRS